MRILAIDTSCDETSAAVTEDTRVFSSIIWSQASLHASWGGVVPSLAQRMHRERIDFVVQKALSASHCTLSTVDAIAITQGPGLAIALEVGIAKAKELANKYHKPLIAVNHIEAHVLSPLGCPKNLEFRIKNLEFPCLGLVISGGHTDLIQINKIGDYKILAQTQDDALGEALDKAARMLGLGYPGGPILEKFSREGRPDSYPLPTPMLGREKEDAFSYSGLKTAFFRLIEREKPLTKEKICNLAASFQDTAFNHLVRVLDYAVSCQQSTVSCLLVGGGVSANIEVRKRLRNLCRPLGIKVLFPYSKKLCGDNAAMIGVAAHFKALRGGFVEITAPLDRDPRMRL